MGFDNVVDGDVLFGPHMDADVAVGIPVGVALDVGVVIVLNTFTFWCHGGLPKGVKVQFTHGFRLLFFIKIGGELCPSTFHCKEKYDIKLERLSVPILVPLI